MVLNKYVNGKIYKLTSINTERIYTGSTYNTLQKRFYKHKFDNPYMGYGDVKIELIEDYPCHCKYELLKRERHYFDLYKHIVVNKNVPSRTQKEYYEDNRIDIIDNQKKYNKENKGRIVVYQKGKYKKDREQRLNYQKKYNKDNKVIISNYKKERLERLKFINTLMMIDY